MGDKKAILKKMKEDEMTNLVSIVVETIEEVNNLKKTIKKIEGQISTAYDAIQFEEEHHPFVQDNDFLDVMLRRKGNVQQKSKERLDEISPSS